LPCAGLTAWSAVIGEGTLQPGQSVLIQGTGGVSLFALQFARIAGARAIVISSSDEKLERARALGADVTINYRAKPDWTKDVREAAGPEGVDHIVEVGGEKTLPMSLRVIRPGGAISMIGVLSGGALEASLGQIVTRHIRLQGITVGNRDGFEAMATAIGQHKLRPPVDKVFPFADLKPAMDHLKSGAHFGKIVLRHAD
jgi:NADPH:quinone reductase-like Zn-dependent oxidoreductase